MSWNANPYRNLHLGLDLDDDPSICCESCGWESPHLPTADLGFLRNVWYKHLRESYELLPSDTARMSDR